MRKFFAGGNTAYGFMGFFDDIRDKQRAGKTFIIKGGAGTGKSTLMKKVAEYAESRGKVVERYYCSGDIDSLDAVYLPDINLLVADGTAPHAMEPFLVGVEDVYLDVSKGIDMEKIAPYREEISNLGAKKAVEYKNCYAYLKAAGRIAALNCEQSEKTARSSADEVFERLKKSGLEKCRGNAKKGCFLSAVTAEGITDYSGEDFSDCRLIEIRAADIYSALAITDRLFLQSSYYGVECTGYRDALLADKVRGIFYPGINTFVTSGEIGAKDVLCFGKDVGFEHAVLNESSCADLLDIASDCLYAAKSAHREIEKYYVSSMQWNVVDSAYEQIIDQI